MRDASPPKGHRAEVADDIYSRRAFDEDIDRARAFSSKGGIPLACAMIDLDDFKPLRTAKKAGKQTVIRYQEKS